LNSVVILDGYNRFIRTLDKNKEKRLDYQISVTQLKGQKGDGDIQAAKRDCNAPSTRDLNIVWLCGRQTYLSDMGGWWALKWAGQT